MLNYVFFFGGFERFNQMVLKSVERFLGGFEGLCGSCVVGKGVLSSV